MLEVSIWLLLSDRRSRCRISTDCIVSALQEAGSIQRHPKRLDFSSVKERLIHVFVCYLSLWFDYIAGWKDREREREWLEGRKGGGSDLFKYDIPYSSWVNDEMISTLGHVVIQPSLEARTFGIIAWAGFD